MASDLPPTLIARAAAVRLLICDVDGVLTDGRIYFSDEGVESKAFFATDGVGLKLLQRADIEIAWITGSRAPAVEHRARVLGVKHVIMGVFDKLTPLRELCAQFNITPAACACIGDDLPDLPLLTACGLAITVPHAPDALKEAAHYVTQKPGGGGAVREVCDLILAAQNKAPDATLLRSA
ncbi:MAG: HAD hydrolase family protein [Burkholderiales bacterium]|jgi:3-deoxy-D-manno-octulosonate 8-phosphate phosphatase (KDO 8-P phosphatase)|nr:HAD hydrolase family protein [Burkholderiales bacterium]